MTEVLKTKQIARDIKLCLYIYSKHKYLTRIPLINKVTSCLKPLCFPEDIANNETPEIVFVLETANSY